MLYTTLKRGLQQNESPFCNHATEDKCIEVDVKLTLKDLKAYMLKSD